MTHLFTLNEYEIWTDADGLFGCCKVGDKCKPSYCRYFKLSSLLQLKGL